MATEKEIVEYANKIFEKYEISTESILDGKIGFIRDIKRFFYQKYTIKELIDPNGRNCLGVKYLKNLYDMLI